MASLCGGCRAAFLRYKVHQWQLRGSQCSGADSGCCCCCCCCCCSLASDAYYPALCQPNVHVVTSAVREVRPEGVVQTVYRISSSVFSISVYYRYLQVMHSGRLQSVEELLQSDQSYLQCAYSCTLQHSDFTVALPASCQHEYM
jgi:hypothetical protein